MHKYIKNSYKKSKKKARFVNGVLRSTFGSRYSVRLIKRIALCVGYIKVRYYPPQQTTVRPLAFNILLYRAKKHGCLENAMKNNV